MNEQRVQRMAEALVCFEAGEAKPVDVALASSGSTVRERRQAYKLFNRVRGTGVCLTAVQTVTQGETR